MSYIPPSHSIIAQIKYTAKTWEQMTGLKLVRVDEERVPPYDGYLVLRFADGGAVLLPEDENGNYEGEPVCLVDDGSSTGPARILVHFGLLNEVEYHKRRSVEQQREENMKIERDLAELKRLELRLVELRAKLGGPK